MIWFFGQLSVSFLGPCCPAQLYCTAVYDCLMLTERIKMMMMIMMMINVKKRSRYQFPRTQTGDFRLNSYVTVMVSDVCYEQRRPWHSTPIAKSFCSGRRVKDVTNEFSWRSSCTGALCLFVYVCVPKAVFTLSTELNWTRSAYQIIV